MLQPKEASFFSVMPNGVQCKLCPHFCFLKEGGIGKCGVRKNISGKLYSLNYGKACSVAVDPIEKKPLFHFAPGSRIFSVSAMGCNFSCEHCQNWEISQHPRLHGAVFGESISSKDLIALASKSHAQGMGWTYTEPTVFYEYFHDTATLDKKKKFYQVWVSNGFTNPEPVEEASKMLDAVNIDYKGNDKFYTEICGARLEPVLEAMKLYKKLGIWIEIANLLIPGKNDSKNDIVAMVSWIKENLGRETPLHISAYHPSFRMKIHATTSEAIEDAVKIADEYLDFVYAGNIESDRESTFCPSCKSMLIKREGFCITQNNLTRNGKYFECPKCCRKIPIFGSEWTGI